MRGNVPIYEMRAARSLQEALGILSGADGDWAPFAGGTDLMVLLEAGHLSQRRFVSLLGISELRGIEARGDEIRIGALTTYTELRQHPLIQAEFPMLAVAARETGAWAIQNRGTLGGNIANASPAADSPPALLAYDAELVLVGSGGVRRVSYEGFHLGYKKTLLAPGELISEILLPRSAGATAAGPKEKRFESYRKVGTRKAQSISKICFAGRLSLEDGRVKSARIAMGSVAPVPLRCARTEAVLHGSVLDSVTIARARSELEREIAPIDDIRSTREYRERVAGNVLERFLEEACDG